MKKSLKSAALLTLALLMLVTGVYAPFRTAEAAMMYNNATSATIDATIDPSGHLQASLLVLGINGRTTRIDVELYVEKKVMGIFWSRVDIGYTNNTWIDSTTNTDYNNSFLTQLSSGGTYRVTATFTIWGNGGGNDIIVKTDTATY